MLDIRTNINITLDIKRRGSVSTPNSFKEKIQDARYFRVRRVERYQGDLRQDWALESLDQYFLDKNKRDRNSMGNLII